MAKVPEPPDGPRSGYTAVHTAESIMLLPCAPGLHSYEWSAPGFSGYVAGPTVAKVRAHLAHLAYGAGYYRRMGDALKAIKVKRVR